MGKIFTFGNEEAMKMAFVFLSRPSEPNAVFSAFAEGAAPCLLVGRYQLSYRGKNQLLYDKSNLKIFNCYHSERNLSRSLARNEESVPGVLQHST